MIVYEPKADHRMMSSSDQKSQWLITEKKEEEIFRNALDNNWVDKSMSVWSFCNESEVNNFIVLGRDYRAKFKQKMNFIELYISKHVKHREDYWHGYPVNPVSDYPPSEILIKWSEFGISTRRLVKLNKGVR